MPSGIAKRKPINRSAFAGTPRPKEGQQEPEQVASEEAEHTPEPNYQQEPEQRTPEFVPPSGPQEDGTVAEAFSRMAEVLDRLTATEKVSLDIPVTGAAAQAQVLTLELTCARVQVLSDCVNMLYDTSTSMPRIPYGVQMTLKTAIGGEVSVMSLGHSFQFEGTNWQLMSFVVTGPSES